ncbi:MAG: AsmA family protein [Bacteroidales bacterium]|nr:AsmA family protein [Bacteroidales bacterium]
MNKILKTLLKVLGITFVVILALLIIIPVFFKDKVLKTVTEVAKNYVDADVVIGDLDLSLISNFPNATVKLNDVSVVGHNEFAGDTLAGFDRLEVSMNLMSLFGGKIKIKSVVLDNPSANVIVTSGGKANYDIAISDSTATDDNSDTTASSSFALALKKLQVNNLNVTYTDSITDVHAYIDSLNFSLHGDLSDKETILSALMDIAKLNVRLGPIIYINDAFVHMKSDLDADLVNMKFAFKENLFQLNQLKLGLDGWIAVPDTNVRMDLKFGAKETDFLSVLSLIPAEYAKDLEGVKTSGKFSFEGGAKGDFNAVSFPKFFVDFVVDNARFQYPDLPKSVENINVDAHVKCPGDLNLINVDVEKFHLEMANNPVDARVVVQTSKDDIALDGNVNLNLDLGIVNQVVPLDDMTLKGFVKAALKFAGNLSAIEKEQYDKFKAEGDITLSNFETVMTDLPPVNISKAHLIVSPQYGNLEQLNMTLGKSDFNLNGKIDNIFQYVFADSTLKASFNFNSKLIDVNDIYSYDHSAPAVEETASTTATEEATEAPEVPKNINFALNAQIGKILYDSLVIENLSGKIGLKEGVASLNNLNLNMLGGKAFVNGLYNGANQNRPSADLQLDLSEIDIQTTAKTFNTVKDLAPIASSCHGKMTAKVNFKSDFDRYLNPELKTVNGDGRLVTKSVGVTDSKVFNLIGTATKNDKLKNPTLKNINVGFEIIDGNIQIDTTAFKLNDQDANFYGTVGLDQTLDMKVGLVLAETVANSLLCQAVGSDKAGNIKVLAQIGGTVSNPKIIGFSSSATDALKEVVEEKIQEVKEKVSEEAKKLIADAKAQGDKLIATAKATKEKLVNEAKVACEKAKDAAKQVRDQAVAKATEEADKLVEKAGSNPVAKAAAKKAADQAIKKATAEADKTLNDAYKKAESLVTAAENSGDKLVSEAQSKADKLTAEANKKAESIK